MKNTFLFLALLFSASVLFGQAPSTLSLQGVLREVSGAAAADGEYSMTFKMYDVATGGTALWTETQPAFVNNGVYSVQLGAVTPLGLPFDKQYYVGVTVGGTELTPRMVLTAAPYTMSLRGSSNVFAGGGAVGIGTTTPNSQVKLHVAGMSLFETGSVNIWSDIFLGQAAVPRNMIVDNGAISLKSNGWYQGLKFFSNLNGASTTDGYWIQRGGDDSRKNKLVFSSPGTANAPDGGFQFDDINAPARLMKLDNGTGNLTVKGNIVSESGSITATSASVTNDIESRGQKVPISGPHKTVLISGMVKWTGNLASLKWGSHPDLAVTGLDGYNSVITLPAGYTTQYIAGISLTPTGGQKLNLTATVPDNSTTITVRQTLYNNDTQQTAPYSFIIFLNYP